MGFSSREQVGLGINWLAWVVGIFVVLLVLGFAGTAFDLWTMPWVENRKTQIVRNTNQYVTSQQTHLTNLIQQYDKLDAQIAFERKDPANADLVTAQQRQEQGIVDDFCQNYLTLSPEFRTDNLQVFATTHSCS